MSRADKVAEEIKREVSLIIQEDLRDPRLGFTTITRVELTADLRFARVYFSVYGDQKHWQDTQAGLECAAGFIRRCLGGRLLLRLVPDISFRRDHSAEYSILIEQRLKELEPPASPKPPKKRKTKHGPAKTSGRLKRKKE